jgi:hypothetical protein
MSQQPIRFRVGGLPLEISAKLLERFPNSGLCHFARQQQNDPPFLLDHNPFAFLVILDFLRTDCIYIPRNVNTMLVKRLFVHYGLPIDRIVELETESTLPGGSTLTPSEQSHSMAGTVHSAPRFQNASFMAGSSFTSEQGPSNYPASSSRIASDFDLPPAYVPSSSVGPSSDSKKDTLARGKEYYTHSLDSQQKIIYKKLEPMIFNHLLPLLSSHVDEGHERLRVYFAPPGVAKDTIANHTHDEDLGFPKEIFTPSNYGVDITFLTQPKVMDLFQKIIMYSTGIRKLSQEIRNITSRVENAFGLFESMSFDVPVLTIQFPPNCSF